MSLPIAVGLAFWGSAKAARGGKGAIGDNNAQIAFGGPDKASKGGLECNHFSIVAGFALRRSAKAANNGKSAIVNTRLRGSLMIDSLPGIARRSMIQLLLQLGQSTNACQASQRSSAAPH